MSDLFAIGVDIGAGSIKSGTYDRAGFEHKHLVTPIPENLTNELFLESLHKSIAPLLRELPISGIGIGSPGPLDNEKGILFQSANMPSIHNVPIKKYINDKFNIPVYYDNDANCAALGEATFGIYKSCSSLLILTLGTGIGGGFVDSGKLFSGFHGNGIEIGHMTSVIDGAVCGCGQKGCLETYFSTNGFLSRYKEKTGFILRDAQAFFDEVAIGDEIAKEILDFGVLAMTETVRGAIHLLNPEAVVFVGGITAAWGVYGAKLEKMIRARIFPVLNERLKIGVGGNLAGSLGAASLVFQR
jgi:glucokinase